MGCCSEKIQKQEKKHLNSFFSLYKNKKLHFSILNYKESYLLVKSSSDLTYKKLTKQHVIRSYFVKEICELIDDYFNSEKNNTTIPDSKSSRIQIFSPTPQAHNKCLYHILLLSILLTKYIEEDVMKLELSQLLFKVISTIFHKQFHNNLHQSECFYYLFDSLLVFFFLSSEIDSLLNLNKFLLFIEACFNSLESSHKEEADSSPKEKEKRKYSKENEPSVNDYLHSIEVFLNKSLLFISLAIAKTSVLALSEESSQFILKVSLRNLVNHSEELYNHREQVQTIMRELDYGVNYYTTTNTEVSANITSGDRLKLEAIGIMKKMNSGLDTLCKYLIRFTQDLSSGKYHLSIIKNHLESNIANPNHRAACMDYLLLFIYKYDYTSFNYKYLDAFMEEATNNSTNGNGNGNDNDKEENKDKDAKNIRNKNLREVYELNISNAQSLAYNNGLVKNFKNIINIIFSEGSLLGERKEKEGGFLNNPKDIKENELNEGISREGEQEVEERKGNKGSEIVYKKDYVYIDERFYLKSFNDQKVTEYSICINKSDLNNVNESLFNSNREINVDEADKETTNRRGDQIGIIKEQEEENKGSNRQSVKVISNNQRSKHSTGIKENQVLFKQDSEKVNNTEMNHFMDQRRLNN
mmetsp:Transcript_19522/g.20304  ORF Transcript_19522/g.20304 Transcript_19522/m.20304 type:complete len:640 (+) Transcript_19522:1-1920(+)